MIVKRQTQREGGQILILPSEEEAGALSGRPSSLLSFQKGARHDELMYLPLSLRPKPPSDKRTHESFSLPPLRDDALATPTELTTILRRDRW